MRDFNFNFSAFTINKDGSLFDDFSTVCSWNYHAFVHTRAGIVLPENSTKMKGNKIGTQTIFRNQTKKIFFENSNDKKKVQIQNQGKSLLSTFFIGLFKESTTRRLFVAALCLLTAHFSLSAQACTLSCSNPIDAPANTSPDPITCEVTLSIPSTGFASASCTGTYSVVVTNENVTPATLIFAGQGFNLGETFNLGVLDLGQLIKVTYFHQAQPPAPNNCDNYFLVVDEVPPTITCTDVTIECTVPFDDEDINFSPATVSDNCFGTQNLEVHRLNSFNCTDGAGVPAGLTEVVIREWTVFDPAIPNMTSSCLQQVSLTAPDLDNIIFPADTIVDCGLLDPTNPTNTGQASINGFDIPFNSINNCMLSVDTINGTPLAGCSENAYSFQRTWTVIYWCDNTIRTGTQLIMVADMTAPVITCPGNITIGTSTQPADCGASFLLPLATATDDCSDDDMITITAATSFGGTGFGPYNSVPVGVEMVTYTATDECGNISDCVVEITVVDDETPTPVCEEFTTISLNTSGVATVPACVFDANSDCNNPASYDDCSPIAFRASLTNGSFTDNLSFDCTQAGGTFNVFLQVYETVNPASATVCMVNVIIEDNNQPALSCPANVTTDCQDDFSNLDDFGVFAANDNCDLTTTTDSLFVISQCGDGTITRSFIATDASGNSSSCSQVITVENTTPFDGTGINFPANYTETNTCRDPSTLTPTDLNPDYLQDIFPTGGTTCAMLAVSYSDMFFDLNAPACYKIIRTWQVIDWCQYDVDNPSAGGLWTSAQIVRIMDATAPVLTAPNTVLVAVDANCQFGDAINVIATATDGCNPNAVRITNDFNNSTDGTANGSYPLGNTTVTFTANDDCGNTSTMQTIVTVYDDKKPTLVCNSNLTTDLANMGPNGMVMANVDLFVYDAFDNCTATTDIKFYMEVADGAYDVVPTTADLAFTCDDFGQVSLEVYAVDAVGNAEVCLTTIDIQDNNGICENESPEVVVAGAIMTEPGDEMSEVQVMLISSSNALPDMTTDGGIFTFPNLPVGVDYTVVPERDGDDDNGVTTFDIIKMIRHIQNLELLDSPYKIIAADVNNSQSVTMGDVVMVKRLILGIDTEFAFVNSWKFVDMYYEFQNPQNPWEFGFPEVLQLQDLTNDVLAANFTAIKMGDANGTASANYNENSAEERTNDETLIFNTKSQSFTEGEMVDVVLNARDFTSIAGFQFTLNFDADALEFMDMTGGAQIQDGLLFNENDNGQIAISLHHNQGLNIADDAALLKLQFKAKTAGHLGQALNITSDAVRNEAYRLMGKTADAEMLKIALQFDENPLAETAFVLYQNIPNPFHTETKIGFDLPTAESATVRFFDAAGRKLYEINGEFAAGKNEITVSHQDLNARGLIWYQLSTATQVETRKMILR